MTYGADPLMRSVAGVTGEVEAAIAEVRRLEALAGERYERIADLEERLEEAEGLLREAHAEMIRHQNRADELTRLVGES